MAPSPDESLHVGPLQQEFAAFAATTEARAPLYAALSQHVASSPEIAGLLATAPPLQRLPVLLFAAVHRLLLDHPDHALAAWYASIDDPPRPPDADLWTAFRAFVDGHRSELSELLASRTTQTNEVGRCSLLLPAFAEISRETGDPLGHLDVGTSGGLTLLTDRYGYRYAGAAGTVELNVESPLVLDVAVRGPMPMLDTVPTVTRRLGIDRDPLDVTDPDDARWLESCVWPDQVDRLARLRQAITMFRDATLTDEPPQVTRGDAVEMLEQGVARVGADGHPVVTNTWVLNYLARTERSQYLSKLDEIGAGRDLSWVYAEAPALVPELPNGPDPRDPHLTVLTLVRWRGGRRRVDHLATCHPHGYWMQWR